MRVPPYYIYKNAAFLLFSEYSFSEYRFFLQFFFFRAARYVFRSYMSLAASVVMGAGSGFSALSKCNSWLF